MQELNGKGKIKFKVATSKFQLKRTESLREVVVQKKKDEYVSPTSANSGDSCSDLLTAVVTCSAL